MPQDSPPPYDQRPTAPPPQTGEPPLRTTDRLRPLSSVPPDQSGALPTPRDRRNDWLRSLPGVRGFAIVSPAGRAETAAGALDAMELQRQTYLAMLARRVGEELGLAQLAELEVEGPDGRLLLLRQDDGGTLHVLGSANLDPHAIRHGHGGER